MTDAVGPHVQFSGNGDADAVQHLSHFLEGLHLEMTMTGKARVGVDLLDLYFMNSSCLKGFVSWVHKVNTEGQLYRIRFIANARLHWQKRSLATLKRLAPAVVSVEERETR